MTNTFPFTGNESVLAVMILSPLDNFRTVDGCGTI